MEGYPAMAITVSAAHPRKAATGRSPPLCQQRKTLDGNRQKQGWQPRPRVSSANSAGPQPCSASPTTALCRACGPAHYSAQVQQPSASGPQEPFAVVECASSHTPFSLGHCPCSAHSSDTNGKPSWLACLLCKAKWGTDVMVDLTLFFGTRASFETISSDFLIPRSSQNAGPSNCSSYCPATGDDDCKCDLLAGRGGRRGCWINKKRGSLGTRAPIRGTQ